MHTFNTHTHHIHIIITYHSSPTHDQYATYFIPRPTCMPIPDPIVISMSFRDVLLKHTFRHSSLLMTCHLMLFLAYFQSFSVGFSSKKEEY